MNKNDLKIFVDKRILINVDIYGKDYFYEGYIVKFSDDSVIFRDRYGKIVVIKYNRIAKIEESRDDDWKK